MKWIYLYLNKEHKQLYIPVSSSLFTVAGLSLHFNKNSNVNLKASIRTDLWNIWNSDFWIHVYRNVFFSYNLHFWGYNKRSCLQKHYKDKEYRYKTKKTITGVSCIKQMSNQLFIWQSEDINRNVHLKNKMLLLECHFL
jgi:hypothetical protein